jgi:Cu/Zn superoxide dismutase
MKIIALSAISTISAAASAELSAGRPLRGGSPEDEARVLEGRRLSMSMIEESSAQEVAEGDGKYVWDGKWPASTTTEATKAGHDWGSSGKQVSKWSGSKSGKSTSGGKSGKSSSSKDSYWGGGPPSTSGKCLIAHINPLSVADEGVRFPDADGAVILCFTNPLGSSATSAGGADTATVSLEVQGLRQLTAGGFHVHSGTSCADATSQEGHYWNSDTLDGLGPVGDGDPWFNIASPLAPTGTGYTTDEHGTGRAYYFVDYGYGYDDTVGKVIIIHDTVGTQADVDLGANLGNGGYARIACGVLEAH